MSRRNKYREYLKSKQWMQHRETALARTSGFCQFCGDIADHVHHTKYPKQFGEEHPNSLIPVCKRCHDLSHGVQNMKQLRDVQIMSDLSPNGIKLKYLLSGGRVYASSKSWLRALRVPQVMTAWFEAGLTRTAMLKKDSGIADLEMSYMNVPVYRWHVVADLLRSFDRQWYSNNFSNRPKDEQEKIRVFHENYEKLVNWGYDLQERALNNAIQPTASDSNSVTADTLLDAIKEAVAPRLREHDGKLLAHDIVISEIKSAVPVFRDPDEFISIKQACTEQGLDGNEMPFRPKSNENFSGFIGQLLAKKGVEKGTPIETRLDGQSFSTKMNTYRRREIYAAIKSMADTQQQDLLE